MHHCLQLTSRTAINMIRHLFFFIFILLETSFWVSCVCSVNPIFWANNDSNINCDVRMRIESGWVCGRISCAEQGVKYASFRGLPYAQQPLGPLRWQELQPLTPWEDVKIVTEEGPACPQSDRYYGRLARPVGMSESCIFANIHIPMEPSCPGSDTYCQKSGLPILIFVHGGGLQTGSGSSDIHGPEYLVCKGIIVITFNYRLNVFGFLSLNSPSIPGNNGLRDVITFVKWVRRNARYFGGDADNITVGGQSLGSVIAHYLTLSKASIGLFKRVIMMSGVSNGGFYTASPDYSNDIATQFCRHLGINSTDPEEIHRQLIEMDLKEIMKANRILEMEMGMISFVPVVESEHAGTRIIDDDPANLIKQGRGKDIPILAGTTTFESEFFKRIIRKLNIIDRIKENPTLILPPNITYFVSEAEALDLAKMVDDRYFQGEPTVEKLMKYITDSFFLYPTLKMARWRALMRAAPVYLYQFQYDSDFNVIKYGLMLDYEGGGGHLEDQTFILRANSVLDPDEKSFPPRNSDDFMKDWMTKFVVNFMHCSRPLCDECFGWLPVDAELLNYQLIWEPVFMNTHINLTASQRDMFEFHDELFKKAGSST